MPERDDPIIDTLLEETLGGKQPPDLTARILAAWSERAEQTVLGQHMVSPAPVAITVAKKQRRQSSSSWLQFAASLTVAAALLLVGYWSVAPNAPQDKNIGKAPAVKPLPSSPQIVKQAAPGKLHPNKSNSVSPRETSPAVVQTPVPSAPVTNATAPSIVPSPETSVPAHTSAVDDASLLAFVNEQLKAAWEKGGVAPAPRATDAELCRRLFVRVIGRIPTVDELQAFERDRSADKYPQLVDRLLHDERYVEEYARHWSTVWANVLIGRGVGIERDETASREGLEKYLRDSFAANKSYDRIVIELLSATGAGQLGADNFNGAANYLLAHADERGITATASACRVFLGVQLQCAQCHNHPTEPFTQQQFWSMNAFFRQVKVRHLDRNDPAQLLDFDYLGEDGKDQQGLVFYELPSGVLKAAPPMFLNGHEPPVQSGFVADLNRREALALEITHAEQFSPALVNRMWSQFHGYGFTRPIDDMGPANAPSHPEILKKLATEFIDHKFDLKRMVRWLAMSDSFQRSSRNVNGSLADQPAAGTAPLFSYYYTRPLPAEEVIRSLQIAAKLRRDTGTQGNIAQARVDWLAQYQRSLPKGSEDSVSSNDPAAAMQIINGGLMKHATSPGYESLLQGVLQSKLKFTEKVEHLFLAALSRKPTKPELAAAQKLTGISGMNESAALEDIWWALLNSSEFLLDH